MQLLSAIPQASKIPGPLLIKHNAGNLTLNIQGGHDVPQLTRLYIPLHDHNTVVDLQPYRDEVAGLVERELPGPLASRGACLEEGELASLADGEGDEGIGGDCVSLRVNGVGDSIGSFVARGDGEEVAVGLWLLVPA